MALWGCRDLCRGGVGETLLRARVCYWCRRLWLWGTTRSHLLHWSCLGVMRCPFAHPFRGRWLTPCSIRRRWS